MGLGSTSIGALNLMYKFEFKEKRGEMRGAHRGLAVGPDCCLWDKSRSINVRLLEIFYYWQWPLKPIAVILLMPIIIFANYKNIIIIASLILLCVLFFNVAYISLEVKPR